MQAYASPGSEHQEQQGCDEGGTLWDRRFMGKAQFGFIRREARTQVAKLNWVHAARHHLNGSGEQHHGVQHTNATALRESGKQGWVVQAFKGASLVVPVRKPALAVTL